MRENDLETADFRMSNQPLVSAIIIFRNAERFLHEAIESVFAQTYPAWELLLVDDGSTDNSARIAREAARQKPERVCCLEHEGCQNRGMSASRNLGASHARGEYLAFLDADDAWYPYTLLEQVAILEAHPPAGMVYGRLLYWFSWTGKTKDSKRDYIEELGIEPDILIEPARLLLLFLQDKAAVPSGILVRRKAFERVGGFEESFSGEYEDQALSAKICLNFPVISSNQVWYRYRQHPASNTAMSKKNRRDIEARLFFLNWLDSYLDEKRINENQIRLALKTEFQEYKYPLLHYGLENKRRFTNWVRKSLWSTGRKTIPAPVRIWLWTRWQKILNE